MKIFHSGDLKTQTFLITPVILIAPYMILCPCSLMFYFYLAFSVSCRILSPAVTFTSLLWPSGSHPWLWLLTTSPTELQIGQHTMPQILIHQHNAVPGHTPCSLPYCPHHIPSVSFPFSFASHSFYLLG